MPRIPRLRIGPRTQETPSVEEVASLRDQVTTLPQEAEEEPEELQEALQESMEPQDSLEQKEGEESQQEEQSSNDDLLSIFRSEEVEDPGFESLVAGLKDVDIHDLVRETQEIAALLRDGGTPS